MLLKRISAALSAWAICCLPNAEAAKWTTIDTHLDLSAVKKLADRVHDHVQSEHLLRSLRRQFPLWKFARQRGAGRDILRISLFSSNPEQIQNSDIAMEVSVNDVPVGDFETPLFRRQHFRRIWGQLERKELAHTLLRQIETRLRRLSRDLQPELKRIRVADGVVRHLAHDKSELPLDRNICRRMATSGFELLCEKPTNGEQISFLSFGTGATNSNLVIKHEKQRDPPGNDPEPIEKIEKVPQLLDNCLGVFVTKFIIQGDSRRNELLSVAEGD